MAPDLSVIIPCLNEDTHFLKLLDQLQKQKNIQLEIILADGGSKDNSVALAKKRGLKFCVSSKGRGIQMNCASQLVTSEYLLFLHGDSEIRDDLLLVNALSEFKKLQTELQNVRLAGHFGLNFIRHKHKYGLSYRYVEEKTFMNRPNTTNGDQGLLIHRKFFDDLGGFDESLGFLEDQVIAEEIRRRGKWITLSGVLYTSARRFESEGFFRRYLLMAMMMGLHNSGLKKFFELAPEVYSEQSQTKHLEIYPFYRVIDQTLSELGLWGSICAWYRVGKYARSHSWQIFYFFDQCFRPLYKKRIYPLVRLHDKVLYPITNHFVSNGIVTVIVYFCFGIVLRTYFYFQDRPQTKSNSVPPTQMTSWPVL